MEFRMKNNQNNNFNYYSTEITRINKKNRIKVEKMDYREDPFLPLLPT